MAAPAAAEWGEAQIRASRIVHRATVDHPDSPSFAADPLNVFVLADTDGGGITLLDGEHLERIHAFAINAPLAGDPQFTPDGRYAYFVSPDGWVRRLDLWNFALLAEVRAGLVTREIAISSDGRHVAVANDAPPALVVLDAELNPVRVIEGRDLARRRSSRIAAVRDVSQRRSFVAALPQLDELWEVSYDPKAPEIAEGLVHDYKLREGAFESGFLRPRRTPLDRPVDEIHVLPGGRLVAATHESRGPLQVVHLDVRRRIATVELPGMLRLRDAATWRRNGRTLLAVPNGTDALLAVVDAVTWKPVRQIPLLGPGKHLSSHPLARYATLDAALAPDRADTLQLIDTESLAVIARLQPVAGGIVGDVAFDRHGQLFVTSVAAPGDPLIAYDASTLREVKRLSIGKPVRKYNVFNHISR